MGRGLVPSLLPHSLVCTAPSTQGHIYAAAFIGTIYSFGQGVAVDNERAMAAYKIGAEGGHATSQYQLGYMYCEGRGIDSPDYEQALVWFEKAAAQNDPWAVRSLGIMSKFGEAQTPSWRRAREHFQRAIGLGHEEAGESMQTLNADIQEVTRSHTDHYSGLRNPHFRRPRSPPSWTTGSRSTAPPATT